MVDAAIPASNPAGGTAPALPFSHHPSFVNPDQCAAHHGARSHTRGVSRSGWERRRFPPTVQSVPSGTPNGKVQEEI